ncbi:hypothetical protein GPALN_013474 [Globodera pallida]|nr:hypothetical protein GPALN_013474 [Globodera pallida]
MYSGEEGEINPNAEHAQEEGELLSSGSSEGQQWHHQQNQLEIEFLEVISRRQGQEGKSLLTRNGHEYCFDKLSMMNDNKEFWRLGAQMTRAQMTCAQMTWRLFIRCPS